MLFSEKPENVWFELRLLTQTSSVPQAESPVKGNPGLFLSADCSVLLINVDFRKEQSFNG